MKTLRIVSLTLVAGFAACSTSSNGTQTTGAGGNGGTSPAGTGGKPAAGGSTGSGGSATGGANGSGGVTGAGGTGGSAGATATGGTAGGAGKTGTGGTAGGAGKMGSGGAVGSGGKTGSGGTAGAGTGGAATGGAGGTVDAGAVASPHFDWVGVIGTGQSLSVGTTPASSTTQPYNNLMLSLEGVTVPGTGTNPWDSSSSSFMMVPLIEPQRALETTYPSPYPGNLYGETPHAAMANEITALVRAASAGADYITTHTIVGESGQGIVALVKETGSTTGTTGRAYAASLFEASAISRLAQAAGKSYGVGVVVLTHGETDCNNDTYGASILQLLSD